MDFNTLPDTFLSAGAEYDAALNRLGLKPEGLLWAHDATINQFVLVLVTSQFDSVGPTEIFRLLTKAYNASVTPREINPFIVRLHSVNHAIVAGLDQAINSALEFRVDFTSDDGALSTSGIVQVHIGTDDLRYKKEWVYHFKIIKLKPADRSRRWKKFARNVEELAA